MRTLVIQNQEFAGNVRRALFMIYCPLKLRQWHSGCSPEHRMCPMDFVSALMGVRRKRAAAGQLFVSNTVWRHSNRHEASFAQGGSYRLSEDAHLGRLEILSTSVSGGHPECHSRSVARTQKLSPAEILANSMILSKIVLRSGASHSVRAAGEPRHRSFTIAKEYLLHRSPDCLYHKKNRTLK